MGKTGTFSSRWAVPPSYKGRTGKARKEKYNAEDSGFWKYLDHPLNPTCLKVREVFPDVAYSFNLLQLDII